MARRTTTEEAWVQLATRIPKSLHRELKLHCVHADTSVMGFDRTDAEAPPLDQALVGTLAGGQGLLVASDAEEGNRDEPLLAELRARDIELALGLRVNERFVGLLTLGRRGDHRLYDDDDIALVMTLANQLAIALENARLYEELRQSRDEVNRVSRLSAVGTLAAGIAHEVRNPLVAVRTFLELFPDRLNDHRFLTDFGRLARNEMGRVERLITDLLTLARGHERNLAALDLQAVVEPIVRLVGPQAEQRHVTFSLARGTHVPLVYGSAEQLEQVMLNLVLNAVQASPDGGTVTVRVEPGRGSHGEPQARVEVVDHGTGVPAEYGEAIFTPFFTTKDGGTGLGLAIAHEIVAEHGGSVAVASTPGGGATFTVTLPAAASAEPQAA